MPFTTRTVDVHVCPLQLLSPITPADPARVTPQEGSSLELLRTPPCSPRFLRRSFGDPSGSAARGGCCERRGWVPTRSITALTMDRLNFLSFFLLCLTSVASGNKANKHKPWIETEYQGIVMENDNTVLLNPPLFALDKDAPLHYAGEICGFRVHNGPSGSGTVQFEAVVLDRSTGEGLVRSKEPLDCENQREHSFTIQAYDCGEGPDGANSKKSHKATVHVRVNDVNEFSPVFVERRYEASVPEGRLFDRIVRVEALDADCSPQYSQICFYDIITPNVPFAIDNDGNIKNTEPLDSKHQRVHTFWVTAFDCGKNRAQADAQVVVTVKPSCKPGWMGWTKRVEYTPGSGSIPLFPGLHLETSVRGEVDLLPPPSPAANWTSALPTLPSSDSSLVFSFNGSNHVAVVPDPVVSALSGDHFTLQLWMRRGGGNIQPATAPTRGNRKEEETIVCSTVRNDDSFSHYSLSVHGCRLSLFYWPDVAAARPVKFLWKLEQVCDSEWHHLSLSVQFPSVTLYVDGVTFDPALIHDNGAIPNPAPRQRMFIGACWEPDEKQKEMQNNTISEVKYVGSYHGLLSGVTVRPGSVEPHSVVECLYACREGLDFGDLETLGSGMKVHCQPQPVRLSAGGRRYRELQPGGAAGHLQELPPLCHSWSQTPQTNHIAQMFQ
ncbi:hypothetical protein fugu_010259 [Takifugu bimaculatus]|uniref:Calsyntenin-3 n=1 Tax=Takifugu bimaculatus TaxID=433685 RepID=A0A4Z2CEV1_9TELE|nr:hypothetical protein fugu_010259 [Takifugu bimaculatus]